MTVAILFIFGAIVGSFLNVVGLRWNSGMSFGGRSHCHTCREKLGVLELVPIFSFIFLRGRCRKCRAKISRQYLLVELWTGLIFATVPLALLPLFCLFVLIAIYDSRHKIIPDNLVYPTIIYALVYALSHLHTYALMDFFAGPALFAFFASIWVVSGGQAMGFADAKLSLAVGLALGASLGFSAIIYAFWIGAGVGLVLLMNNKNITMKSELPFAPFIILGAWVSLILQIDLLHVTQIF